MCSAHSRVFKEEAMFLSLDVRRARKGDCLILHYGSKEDPHLVLIDGGPAQVYGPHLKPRLKQVRKARGLNDDDPLPVDLLMVSHIDDDHIKGVLELTKELVEAKDSGKPLPLKVMNFWHNTFDNIIGKNPEELKSAVTDHFGPASLSGEPDVEGLDPDAAKVLASVDQGIRLRDDAKKLQLKINAKFDGDLVMALPTAEIAELGGGLKFTVVGPMRDELLNLQKDHDAFLKKKENEKKTAGALASFTDTSVPNLSSLVLIAEVGGKRILLTGDARGDKILEGLEFIGQLEKDGKSKIHFDILKMPHHGSDRNIDPIFFQRINADHYVFSGNGEHGNPERETLQMLLDESGDGDFTIHLTYPVEEIDIGRKKDWEEEQQKERSRQKKNPKVNVRKDWSPEDNSLTAFFEANKEFANKLSIVGESEPHVIDLLDKIGF
jgi:hypothetical protein